MTLLIRAANPSEVPCLVALAATAATAPQWRPEDYHRLFCSDAPDRLVLVAERDRSQATGPAIEGFIVVLCAGPDWEIENIVVAPDAQRRGIGKRLVTAVRQSARRQGATGIYLEVRESNRAARALYESTGFRPCGRRSGYYSGPREDAIVYRAVPSPADPDTASAAKF